MANGTNDIVNTVSTVSTVNTVNINGLVRFVRFIGFETLEMKLCSLFFCSFFSFSGGGQIKFELPAPISITARAAGYFGRSGRLLTWLACVLACLAGEKLNDASALVSL